MNKNDLIIVGNGPSLLKAELGNRIDLFPNILRFNNFKTLGYEQNVGMKTTIWSKWHAIPNHTDLNSFKTIWLNVPLRDRTYGKLKNSIRMLGTCCKIELIPNFSIAEKLQMELFDDIDSNLWPSSGLLAIVHAISKKYNVHIVGIDSWASEPFHYYEHHDRSNSHHSASLEKDYINSLVKRKLIYVVR